MAHIAQLALPMAGSRFIQMFTGFINTMMASHLGHQILAACALVGASLSFTLLIFISILFSVSFIVGRSYGAQEYGKIGALVQQGMVLSFLLSLLLLGCFFLIVPMLRLFHQDPAILLYVHDYFYALAWGAIPILLQCCLEQFFYGILKQRLVLVINIICMCFSISIAYVFIFGKLGLPSMGIASIGLAFALQAWLNFLLLLACCYFLKTMKPYQLFHRHAWQGLIYCRKILSVGWPIGLQLGGELGAYFVMTMMIGWLGMNALAAVQITQQWMYLVIVPIYAISEAAGIMVGQSVGANRRHLIYAIGRSSIIFSLGLILLLDAAFVCFPNFFASFYLHGYSIDNFKILQLVRPLFLLMAFTLIFNTTRNIFAGLLRGLLDTQFPMRIGIGMMWLIVLPLGYLFAFYWHGGVIGFRWGENIGLLIGAIIIYWRWAKLGNQISEQ